MASCHRALLTRHRVYLLHNMHPTEEFWSHLISNGVLSTEMAAGIKVSNQNKVLNTSLLAIIVKYGVPIRELALLCQAFLGVYEQNTIVKGRS